MENRISGFAIVGIALSLTGCMSMGPRQALTTDGPARKGDAELTQPVTLEGRFYKTYTLSAQHAEQDLVKDGFSLIYSNCSDFFDTAGKRQVWLNFSQDTLNVLTATAITYMTTDGDLKNNEEGIANMALFGTAFNSGVDIYTKHFLFSAENIASVKNLTLKALSTHQDAVLDQGNLSFQDAVMRLNDNQAICTPRSIALLAKQAIAVGDVEPATTSEELAQKGEDQDQTALLKLNEVLGFDGAMQKERAYYFWWSQFGPELQSARVKENIFVQGFGGMKKDSVPYNVKLTETPNWKVTYQDKVRAALNLLSSHTKSEFRSNATLQAKQFVSVDVAEAQYEAEVADAKLGIRASPTPQKFTTPTSLPPEFTEVPTSRSGFVSLTVK